MRGTYPDGAPSVLVQCRLHRKCLQSWLENGFSIRDASQGTMRDNTTPTKKSPLRFWFQMGTPAERSGTSSPSSNLVFHGAGAMASGLQYMGDRQAQIPGPRGMVAFACCMSIRVKAKIQNETVGRSRAPSINGLAHVVMILPCANDHVHTFLTASAR